MSKRKYDENSKCIICGNTGVVIRNMCRKCYYHEYDKNRTHKTPCTILKEHHREMKDDPERLTTDFIQDLINVNCDNKEK